MTSIDFFHTTQNGLARFQVEESCKVPCAQQRVPPSDGMGFPHYKRRVLALEMAYMYQLYTRSVINHQDGGGCMEVHIESSNVIQT